MVSSIFQRVFCFQCGRFVFVLFLFHGVQLSKYFLFEPGALPVSVCFTFTLWHRDPANSLKIFTFSKWCYWWWWWRWLARELSEFQCSKREARGREKKIAEIRTDGHTHSPTNKKSPNHNKTWHTDIAKHFSSLFIDWLCLSWTHFSHSRSFFLLLYCCS